MNNTSNIDLRTTRLSFGRVTAPGDLRSGDIVLLIERHRFRAGLACGAVFTENSAGITTVSKVDFLNNLGWDYGEIMDVADKKFSDAVILSVDPKYLRGIFTPLRWQIGKIVGRAITEFGASFTTKPFDRDEVKLGQVVYATGAYEAVVDRVSEIVRQEGYLTFSLETYTNNFRVYPRSVIL